MESINKKLQADDTTLADVRALFDHVIDSFPTATPRLQPDANIVHSPDFESGLVKLQLGNNNALSRSERIALRDMEPCR